MREINCKYCKVTERKSGSYKDFCSSNCYNKFNHIKKEYIKDCYLCKSKFITNYPQTKFCSKNCKSSYLKSEEYKFYKKKYDKKRVRDNWEEIYKKIKEYRKTEKGKVVRAKEHLKYYYNNQEKIKEKRKERYLFEENKQKRRVYEKKRRKSKEYRLQENIYNKFKIMVPMKILKIDFDLIEEKYKEMK